MKVTILIRAETEDKEHYVTRAISEYDLEDAQYPMGLLRAKIKEVKAILAERISRPDIYWMNESDRGGDWVS